jgi:hypothetical protein
LSFKINRIFILLGICLAFAANPTIQNMAADTWYEVPNSHMASVGVECGSECPECPDHWPDGSTCTDGNSKGVAGVIDLWSGGTFDTKRNRLVIWGGGHKGYGGNELYGFDLDDLTWERIVDPSFEAVPCVSIYPDGTPVSRHTYGLPIYLPNQDVFFACPMVGRFCGGSGADPHTWYFDFEGGQWINKNPGGIQVNGQHGGTVYDPVTNKVYGWSTSYSGQGGFFAYDVAANRWDNLNPSRSNFWGAPNGALDTKRNRIVIIGANGGEIKVIDLSDPSYTIQSIATSGGGSNVLNGQPGVVYDPVVDRIVAWDGGPVWVMHPENWTWTQKATCPQAATGNGTYGRFAYSPSENAYVVTNAIDQNVMIYKLTAGAGVSDADMIRTAGAKLQMAASPNPFTASISIRISHAARVRIMNIRGTMVEDFGKVGRNAVLQWDGADRQGKRMAAGIYWVRIDAGNKQLTRRVLKIR